MKKYYVGALVLLGSLYASSYAMEEKGEEATSSATAIDELIAFVDNEDMAMDQVMELKKKTMAEKMKLIDSQRKKMAAIKKNQLKKWKKNTAKYEDDARELLMELKDAKKEHLGQWKDFITSNKEEWLNFIEEKQKDLGSESDMPETFAVIEEVAFNAPQHHGTTSIVQGSNGNKTVTRMPHRNITQTNATAASADITGE